jgi:CheY-like chemotaxis protein
MLENVMLIDDDQFVLMMNEMLLQSAGFTKKIKSVTGVDEAMAYLETKLGNELEDSFPELIFVDLDMPDKTGWDFLEELKTTYPSFSTKSKVIILSSSIISAHYEKVKQYPDVIEMMPKPLKLETIILLKSHAAFKDFW